MSEPIHKKSSVPGPVVIASRILHRQDHSNGSLRHFCMQHHEKKLPKIKISALQGDESTGADVVFFSLIRQSSGIRVLSGVCDGVGVSENAPIAAKLVADEIVAKSAIVLDREELISLARKRILSETSGEAATTLALCEVSITESRQYWINTFVEGDSVIFSGDKHVLKQLTEPDNPNYTMSTDENLLLRSYLLNRSFLLSGLGRDFEGNEWLSVPKKQTIGGSLEPGKNIRLVACTDGITDALKIKLADREIIRLWAEDLSDIIDGKSGLALIERVVGQIIRRGQLSPITGEAKFYPEGLTPAALLRSENPPYLIPQVTDDIGLIAVDVCLNSSSNY